MRVIKMLSVFVCCLLLFATTASALGSTDYILDTDGRTHIPIPTTYNVEEVYEYFGEEAGFLTAAMDLFVAKDDTLYVADTGNNRVLHLDANGNLLKVYTAGDSLSGPQGVYVDADMDVYISDSANNRIVHVSPEDEVIEEFVKPDSELLDEDMRFEPGRIALSPQGNFYVLQGQYFMSIDASNRFCGYVGNNKVGFSLRTLLIRTFGNKAQKDQLYQQPPSYNSFAFGDDGMIYALTDETLDSGQIQAINAAGTNVYPAAKYGEPSMGNPRFVDITVSKDKNLYVLEQRTCQVYIYDSKGELLAVFGGKGTIKGKFELPVAIDINSNGDIFVLDKQTGCIHRFSNTVFFEQILSAISYYKNGQYDEAMVACEEILETDSYYPVASKLLAQCLAKSKSYKEAMEYFKLANAASGYGTMFAKYRHELFREYFGWIIAAIAAIIAAVILICKLLKKKSDASLDDYFGRRGIGGMNPIKKALLILVHPLDFMDILKRDYTRKSMWSAPILMSIAVVINYVCIFFTHYSLGGRQAIDANIFLEIAVVVIPLVSWAIASYAMTAIMNGETHFGEVLTAVSYALTPYIILKPIITLISNIMGYTEKGLYDTIQVIAVLWVLVLIFIAFKQLNDYTFWQAVGTALVSLFAMVVMWAVILLVCALVLQLFTFLKSAFMEFSLKYLG